MNTHNNLQLPLQVFEITSHGLDSLLAKVSRLVAAKPELVERNYDGTFGLFCEPPKGYKPNISFNEQVERLSMRVTVDGVIIEISEVNGTVSGGWMASCIPLSIYRVFLSAWLDQNSEKQLELVF